MRRTTVRMTRVGPPCKKEARVGEPTRPNEEDEQEERQSAAAEQRIIRGEQLLTRLAMLSEDRRSFGLGNAPTEMLIGKISRKLNEWIMHRDAKARSRSKQVRNPS